ncbi:MAG: peptidoglycan editing factor PgeF [Acidobacteria bacterium]|nr:peptidoglycan editing factor PgeF [Acidobacteriota bacterium]
MQHFKIKQQEGVKVIECSTIREKGFIAAFSTRLGGVSKLPENALNLALFSSDTEENVSENRRRFLSTLSTEPKTQREIVTVKQIHSADSYVVEKLSPDNSISCDAMLTNNRNILLGIQTSDCLPVLIADPKNQAVVGIHAGWRGTLSRIVEKSIARLVEIYGSNPSDCLAATGPAIGQCCFEIGPEVKEAFEKEFPYADKLFSNHQENGKSHMDLRLANQEQLLKAGLKKENIFVWPDCTLCSVDLYFSYRGEIARGAVGRLLSVIGLA